MPRYIYERPDWPKFHWDHGALANQLGAVRHRQGRLIGRMQALGFPLREEAVLKTLTEDVLKSSEIEGEILDRDQVRSSIARRLGIDAGALLSADRNVEGVVEMMLDATQRFDQPLSVARLFGWHGALFPTGRSGLGKIKVAQWRDENRDRCASFPAHMVARRFTTKRRGPIELDHEMRDFLTWFNHEDKLDPVIKAALAHLWFVTIHPFDDGNGRIARAIADMSLARSEASPQRFYSMSAQIQLERHAYYEMLEATQKGDLDITRWLEWFLACLGRAFDGAEAILSSVVRKAEFWRVVARTSLNDRQRDILNRLLDGFEGKLTSSKWAKIEKCSADTALRDINELVAHGILARDEAGGRSTSYSLTEIKADR